MGQSNDTKMHVKRSGVAPSLWRRGTRRRAESLRSCNRSSIAAKQQGDVQWLLVPWYRRGVPPLQWATLGHSQGSAYLIYLRAGSSAIFKKVATHFFSFNHFTSGGGCLKFTVSQNSLEIVHIDWRRWKFRKSRRPTWPPQGHSTTSELSRGPDHTRYWQRWAAASARSDLSSRMWNLILLRSSLFLKGLKYAIRCIKYNFRFLDPKVS